MKYYLAQRHGDHWLFIHTPYGTFFEFEAQAEVWKSWLENEHPGTAIEIRRMGFGE